MADIYFGAIFPPVSLTGNWQNLNDWYLSVGYANKGGTIYGTLLGRFPNTLTDNVIVIQTVLSNVATYNGTSWSTDHTYSGPIAGSAGFTGVFDDQLAVFSNTLTVNYSSIHLKSGTFTKPITVQSNGSLFLYSSATITSGVINSLPGVYSAVVETMDNQALSKLTATSLSQYYGKVGIGLSGNETTSTSLQIGNTLSTVYNVNAGLTISGNGFRTNRNFTVYSKNTDIFRFSSVTLTGIISIIGGTNSVSFANSNYNPSVNINLSTIQYGGFTVNGADFPISYGCGAELGGTFNPTITIINSPINTANTATIPKITSTNIGSLLE